MLKEARYRGIKIQYSANLMDGFHTFDLLIRGFRKQKDLLDQFGLDFVGKRKSTTLLFAHGGYTDGFWAYWDLKEKKPMREWILREEQESDLLLIYSCNPRNYEISSRKAKVIHPMSMVRPLVAAHFGNPMRVYDPETGYTTFNI